MFTMKFPITLSKHTHFKMKVIQIQSFELLITLNPLKFLITLSKHTLRVISYQHNQIMKRFFFFYKSREISFDINVFQ
jgi:hypothetical protein